VSANGSESKKRSKQSSNSFVQSLRFQSRSRQVVENSSSPFDRFRNLSKPDIRKNIRGEVKGLGTRRRLIEM